MRQNVGCQIDESAAKLGKEFTGLSGTIYFITELFNPLLKPFENYRNNKGKGASLLVVGKKR